MKPRTIFHQCAILNNIGCQHKHGTSFKMSAPPDVGSIVLLTDGHRSRYAVVSGVQEATGGARTRVSFTFIKKEHEVFIWRTL